MFSLSRRQIRGIVKLLILLALFTSWRFLDRFIIADVIPVPASAAEVTPRPMPYLELNSADSADLDSLPGIGPVLSARIIRYRNSIGGFSDFEQLSRVFGMKPETIAKIQPMVCINPPFGRKLEKFQDTREWNIRESRFDMENQSNREKVPFPKTIPLPEGSEISELLDINSADSLQLIQVPGIGPVFASRILERKARLGYFHSLNQLTEIRGIYGESFERIKDRLEVIPPSESGEGRNSHGILINEWPVETLAAHPYIGWKNAKLIVSYRDAHGAFHSMEDCRKMQVIGEVFWGKVEPYLRF